MSKIYLPSEYINNCNVVNNGYIRSYTNNSKTEWVDIYVNQDYMLKPGYTTYSNNVTCDTLNTYTDDFYYRTDFDKICLLFIIFVIFVCYLPFKIVSKLFVRGAL